jgi:hypothetical protein
MAFALSAKKPPPAPPTLGGAAIPIRPASASSPLVVATSSINAILTKQPSAASRRGADAPAPVQLATSPLSPTSASLSTSPFSPPKLLKPSSSALSQAAAANPGARVLSPTGSSGAAAASAAVLSPTAASAKSFSQLQVDTSKPPARAAAEEEEDEPASEEEPESPPDNESQTSAAANHAFDYLERKTRQSVVFLTGGLSIAGVDGKKPASASSAPSGVGVGVAGVTSPTQKSGAAAPAAGAGAGAAPKKTAAELTAMERTKLAEEIVSTEKTYVDGLAFVVKMILLRLRKAAELGREWVDAATLTKLFLNVEEIYDLHLQVCGAVLQSVERRHVRSAFSSHACVFALCVLCGVV